MNSLPGDVFRKRPKAILFDLGDTLLRETRLDLDGALDRLREWSTTTGSPVDPARWRTEIRGLYSEVRETLRGGIIEFPMRGLLQLAGHLFGLEYDCSPDELELKFWRALCSMEPLPGVAAVLSQLRGDGIATGVVSNSVFSRQVLEYELRKNGLADFFQVIVSSADYGIQKPHPAIFSAALARLNTAPSETWFVGDNIGKDIMGATRIGMCAVWINEDNPPQPLQDGVIQIRSWPEFLSRIPQHD